MTKEPLLLPLGTFQGIILILRFVFGLMAGIIGGFAHSMLISMFVDPNSSATEDQMIQRGYTLSATIFAVVIALAPIITAVFVREKNRREEVVKVTPILESLKYTFTNKPYVLLLLTYLLSWVTINFVQNNLLLWVPPSLDYNLIFFQVKYVIRASDQFSYLVLAIQASSTIMLPVMQRLTQWVGKKNGYFMGMSTLILVLVYMYFLGEGQIIQAYVCASMAGIGVATGILIPWSMLPDCIDLDEVRSGKRREGDMYSIFLFFQKIGLGGALAFSGYTLGWVGYITPSDEDEKNPFFRQPDNVLTALRLMVTLVPAGLLIISFFAVFFYPITKKRHLEILDEIAAVKSVVL